MNIKIIIPWFACLLWFSVSNACAGMQNEIEHLLEFVKNTPCRYERNGVSHTGAEAAVHIQNKYNYFMDEIESAEKFIELSATKSTMSGKYYTIQCDGKAKIKSQQWLLEELHNYRNNTRSRSGTGAHGL